MKPYTPTWQINMGCGGWLVSLRVDSTLPTVAHSIGCSTFQAAHLLSSLYVSAFLCLGCPYSAEDYELLNSTSTKSLHCTCSISANSHTLYRNTERAHTLCTHFNRIFEIMSSLRCNYAIYRGTIPLNGYPCRHKYNLLLPANSQEFKLALNGPITIY